MKEKKGGGAYVQRPLRGLIEGAFAPELRGSFQNLALNGAILELCGAKGCIMLSSQCRFISAKSMLISLITVCVCVNVCVCIIHCMCVSVSCPHIKTVKKVSELFQNV